TKTGYNFSPQSRTLNNLFANQTANFAATIPVVSVSAASYGATGLAPGSIASAFGTNLAEVAQPATTLPLPTELGGTTVNISDSRGTVRDAPLLYVSPGQINFYVPPGTATGIATITII